MRFEERAAEGTFLFGLDFLHTSGELKADLERFSYNQQVFGPRDKATRNLDVQLPQAFAERKELSYFALQHLLNI